MHKIVYLFQIFYFFVIPEVLVHFSGCKIYNYLNYLEKCRYNEDIIIIIIKFRYFKAEKNKEAKVCQ